MALFKNLFTRSQAPTKAPAEEKSEAIAKKEALVEEAKPVKPPARKSDKTHEQDSLELFSTEFDQNAADKDNINSDDLEPGTNEPPAATVNEPRIESDKAPMSQQSTTKKTTPPAAQTKAAAKAPAGKRAAKPVKAGESDYTAADIEVLEGLEPVRRRPGMYIGGTDQKALHHLFAEVIDNSMDEAVAGFATWIEVELMADNSLKVSDNGRGIPVDPHPKFKNKSALEVILTTLHAGGKFDSKVYATSGGLHGVGASVVNALSDVLEVEVARDKQLYRQCFSRGIPQGKLQKLGKVANRRGTSFLFHPDPQIFGDNTLFRPARLMRMARSKAYLFGGVEIRWKCAPELLDEKMNVPETATFHFPGGLKDFVTERLEGLITVTSDIFSGKVEKEGGHGSVEWAVAWVANADGFLNTYCNTVPTIEGGTHETGLRGALTKGLRAYGEMTGNKKASQITADDVLGTAAAMMSVFIREPEFQGQTKEKLASAAATRIVENALRDAFDHWLTANPKQASKLLDWVVDRSEERLKRRRDKEVSRKSATKKLRLPGKLADCSQRNAKGAEIFIVEGDSAGGSAKQARNRKNQAILPLRGKILNVANASSAKISSNQLLNDLTQALGCGVGSSYAEADLRYEKVIIMTDADVDGAHIAALLITFFYRQMPKLVDQGHLFVAVPPLYRITQGAKTLYARDDEHKDELLASEFTGRGKIDIGRFKGLGEMMAAQLKETTMLPGKRTLLQVAIDNDEREETADIVQQLMGNKPEARFHFIQANAEFAHDLDI
jgi:topoisomerase IV subunit B